MFLVVGVCAVFYIPSKNFCKGMIFFGNEQIFYGKC